LKILRSAKTWIYLAKYNIKSVVILVIVKFLKAKLPQLSREWLDYASKLALRNVTFQTYEKNVNVSSSVTDNLPRFRSVYNMFFVILKLILFIMYNNI